MTGVLTRREKFEIRDGGIEGKQTCDNTYRDGSSYKPKYIKDLWEPLEIRKEEGKIPF